MDVPGLCLWRGQDRESRLQVREVNVREFLEEARFTSVNCSSVDGLGVLECQSQEWQVLSCVLSSDEHQGGRPQTSLRSGNCKDRGGNHHLLSQHHQASPERVQTQSPLL